MSEPTAPTSPLVDLRYTVSAPLVGECQVVRDGSRWVLRPHAPHADPGEGQCSCCAETELVMDVDVALSRVGEAGTEGGRWLVTRNDGADLGHLTDVPEPAPWLAQVPVARTQPAQPQPLPTLDDVIAALVPVLGPPLQRFRYQAGWPAVAASIGLDDDAPTVGVWDLTPPRALHPVVRWGVTRDGCSVGGENTVTLDALPELVRVALTRLGQAPIALRSTPARPAA